MSSKNASMSQPKKALLFVMTALLWLATVALGIVALVELLSLSVFLVALLLTQFPEMGAVETRGWVSTSRNVATFAGGLLLLGLTVGGMEFHFRNIGHRKSLRVFMWTLAIEVAIIAAGMILTPNS